MKYKIETVIDLPRERVIDLFDNPDNLSQWQPTLRRFEPLSGTPGQPGAKSRLVFDERGREIEMIETVEARDLPNEFTGVYELPGVWNRVSNRFFDEGEKTRWVVETEFRFANPLMRMLSFLTAGGFRKQSLELMENFKRFAEKA
jgi:uncharacterized protein YndB with AHSA1/START domain